MRAQAGGLAEYLRSRRAALSPHRAGIAATGRRRTSGLRREEIATLAGISVHYYIRMEQGKETNPSKSVLDALAAALDLDADEHRHLYALAAAPQLSTTPVPKTLSAELRTRMTRLTAAVRPNPAYVLNRFSDLVAANPEGLALFDGITDYPEAERNTVRYICTHPRARSLFTHWAEVAEGSVAQLRSYNAHQLTHPHLVALVDELSARSPEFDSWWRAHLVRPKRGATKTVRHPRYGGGGETALPYEVLHVGDEGLRMTLYLPPAHP